MVEMSGFDSIGTQIGSCVLQVVSVDMSTDISVDCRPTIGRHIGRLSVDYRSTIGRLSTDSRPINMSTDILLGHRYSTDT